MKKKLSLALMLFSSALFIMPQTASATLLVGFYNAGATDQIHAGTNFSGTVTGFHKSNFYQDQSGTYGGLTSSNDPDQKLTDAHGNPVAMPPVGTGNKSSYTIQTAPVVVSVTNHGATAAELAQLLFDLNVDGASTVSFAVTYDITGGSYTNHVSNAPLIPSTPIVAASSAAAADWMKVTANLIGINLFQNETISFKFTATGDDYAYLGNAGITAVPEPASLAALACLVGSGLFMRQRRTKRDGFAPLGIPA